MKIGIYDPYFDDLGGGEKYMAIIGQCLAKNHSITFFWDNKKDIKALQKRFLLDLNNVEIKENIFSPNISTAKRFLMSMSYDAIFVLSDGSIPFLGSKKVFVHFQQPMQHIKLLPLRTRLSLKRVSLVFCNSNFTKSFIDKTFEVNSKVIYPPVDLHPKKVKKENIILHVGRFRVRDITVDGIAVGDYKKQSFMIETFKKIVKCGITGWRFILCVSVNPNEMGAFKKMQKQAEGFPIEFLLNRDNLKLWNAYNKAKIYWHASGYGEDLVRHPEYAEHFGISTVEAMGGGAVPIVINAGGQKEIVKDGQTGFLWNSENELLEKTIRLTNDDPLREKIAEKARVRAKDFDLKRFSKQISDLLL